MNRLQRWVSVCGLIVTFLASASAQAALIEVDVVSAVMTAGTTGTIDVILRGTGAPITLFDYRLEITGAAPGMGNVVFTAPINDEPGIDGPTPYVFLNESEGLNSQLASSTEIFGSDGWALTDLTGKILDQDYLLARLNVEHQGGFDLNLAEAMFTISVIEATFFDADGLPYDPSDVQLGSGTLKIVATPEPATLGGLGLASLLLVRRFKRRRTSVSPGLS